MRLTEAPTALSRVPSSPSRVSTGPRARVGAQPGPRTRADRPNRCSRIPSELAKVDPSVSVMADVHNTLVSPTPSLKISLGGGTRWMNQEARGASSHQPHPPSARRSTLSSDTTDRSTSRTRTSPSYRKTRSVPRSNLLVPFPSLMQTLTSPPLVMLTARLLRPLGGLFGL